MIRVLVTDRSGKESVVEASPGLHLMETARNGGVAELLGVCGGCCSCATCHVFVDDAWRDRVGPPNNFEAELLDTSEHRRDNSRLSCQITMTPELDGLRVRVAPED